MVRHRFSYLVFRLFFQCTIEFANSAEYVECPDDNPPVEGTEEEDADSEDGMPNKRIKLDEEAEAE